MIVLCKLIATYELYELLLTFTQILRPGGRSFWTQYIYDAVLHIRRIRACLLSPHVHYVISTQAIINFEKIQCF